MRRLRDATDETVYLAVPHSTNSVVVVDRVDCNRTVRTFYPVGYVSPMHATSLGLAVLAHLPNADIDEILAADLTKYSENTITQPRRLRKELVEIRELGYALNIGRHRPAVCSIASAVLDHDGRPVAGLCISMPDSRYDPDQVPHWGQLVNETATEIAVKLLTA